MCPHILGLGQHLECARPPVLAEQVTTLCLLPEALPAPVTVPSGVGAGAFPCGFP